MCLCLTAVCLLHWLSTTCSSSQYTRCRTLISYPHIVTGASSQFKASAPGILCDSLLYCQPLHSHRTCLRHASLHLATCAHCQSSSLPTMHDPAYHPLFLFRRVFCCLIKQLCLCGSYVGHVCAGLQIPVFLTAVMAVRRMSATAWPGFDTGKH